MKPTFRILSGARAGTTVTPSGDRFTAGRGADAALRFAPEHDLAVSVRHAEFARRDGAWRVRDLDSRNGTFVNGTRIGGEVVLRDGDEVTFGGGGPSVQVRFGAAAVHPADESTTQRLRAAVRRATRRQRYTTAGTLLALIGIVLVVLVANRRERSGWNQERQMLLARIDSLLLAAPTLDTTLVAEVVGLRASLRASQERLASLRSAIDAVQGGSDDAVELRRELLSATTALRRHQLAAALDFAAIQRRNRRAVAMVWVEYEDGGRVTGTAFAVRADGTMLTNRHLVTDHNGVSLARRIAVRFADSEQAFPARVVAIHHDLDLAALRVDNIVGDVPVVAPFNVRADTIEPGAPLALIGFPLGGEPDDPMRTQRIARPLVSAGVIVRSTVDRLDVQGLGAAGGSGSPILDGNGEVVGVLFGGRSEAGVQVLAAIPAVAAAAFLDSIR